MPLCRSNPASSPRVLYGVSVAQPPHEPEWRPVVFIEFDHHPGVFLTNPDPTRFHIHTIVRRPNGNDYGIDLLRQHYA